MELRESPLWNEVEAIAISNQKIVPTRSFRAHFKVGDDRTITATKVISCEFFRDFKGAYADEVLLEVAFPMGTFHYDIFPKCRDIEITLEYQTVLPNATDDLAALEIRSQKFVGTLLDKSSSSVVGANISAASRRALDMQGPVTVTFQLLHPALRDIRLRSVGGIIRNTTPAEILRYILTTVSNGQQLSEDTKVLGVEMVEPNNTDEYSNVVIPHGTRIQDIPPFIQKKVGGIYSTGLGTYLYGQHWHVYPLFDLTRFDKARRTLTIINIPENAMPGIEHTYRTTANQVIILLTGAVKHFDLTENAQLNLGNGVRFLDARRVVDGFVDAAEGDNKAVASRAENNQEFLVESRDDNVNAVVTSQARITANTFEEHSKLSKRLGAEIQALWENSDIDLIEPGMPLKFLYLKDDRVAELKGVVLGAQTYVQTSSVGVTDQRYRVDTALHLFVERES